VETSGHIRIKGSYRSKKGIPKGSGRRVGDPIEHSHEDKVKIAVKDSLSSEAPEGEVWFVAGDMKGVVIDKFKHMPNSVATKYGRGYDNNTYTAKGSVSYKRQNDVTNKLYPAVTKKFSIQFKDSTDSMGIPCLKTESFELI
jgi:hypothetical protein